jgi:hypothetical protein
MLLKNLLSILYSVAAALLLTVLFNLSAKLHSPTAYYGILYFGATCFILNIVYAVNAKSKSFSDLLFAGIIIRLLLALIVILIYAVLFKADFAHFAIHFICHYILFTIFEIRYLLQLIRTNSTKRS